MAAIAHFRNEISTSLWVGYIFVKPLWNIKQCLFFHLVDLEGFPLVLKISECSKMAGSEWVFHHHCNLWPGTILVRGHESSISAAMLWRKSLAIRHHSSVYHIWFKFGKNWTTFVEQVAFWKTRENGRVRQNGCWISNKLPSIDCVNFSQCTVKIIFLWLKQSFYFQQL